MLLIEELYNKVFIEFVERGFIDLKIVSGYVSVFMVFNYFEILKERKLFINFIELIVGMVFIDGINISDY